jgi:hypothetical protein
VKPQKRQVRTEFRYYRVTKGITERKVLGVGKRLILWGLLSGWNNNNQGDGLQKVTTVICFHRSSIFRFWLSTLQGLILQTKKL